jgi:hypothetical protein
LATNQQQNTFHISRFTFHASHFTFYVLRFTFCLVLVLLAACGASGVTQTTQTEHYTVQLGLDGVGFGERQATVEIRDASGSPVSADVVVVAPVMRQMGMASPEAPARQVAPGRYQASGEFFSMIGEWEIDVRINAGGSEEVATFKILATE